MMKNSLDRNVKMYDNNFFHPPAFPDFPVCKDQFLMRCGALLTLKGLNVLPAQWTRDVEFLFEIYANTRLDEVRVMNWSDKEKTLFLTSQLMAQHIHYVTAFPNAAYVILRQANKDIGRVYVDKGREHLHLIDITLHPDYRRQGIGSQIMTVLTAEADRLKLPFNLSVDQNNPAQGLYRRFGFEQIEATPPYLRLQRSPL